LYFFFLSGAIYINIDESSTMFDLSTTSYVGCTASFHGDNVFICGSSLSAVVSQQRFEDVVFDPSETEKFYGEWAGNNSLETLVTWMGKQSFGVYVSVTGSLEDCGTSANPCKFFFFFVLD
jgi:hypothetical protein